MPEPQVVKATGRVAIGQVPVKPHFFIGQGLPSIEPGSFGIEEWILLLAELEGSIFAPFVQRADFLFERFRKQVVLKRGIGQHRQGQYGNRGKACQKPAPGLKNATIAQWIASRVSDAHPEPARRLENRLDLIAGGQRCPRSAHKC